MLVVGAILTLCLLGALLGLFLAVASEKFKVQEDPVYDELLENMPGINCGACGHPGCSGYSKALAAGEDKDTTACVPGGSEVAGIIAGILGVEVQEREPEYAILLCTGGTAVANKFDYAGVTDCVAGALVMGGDKECEHACIGLATCEVVCPYDAIRMGSDMLPQVLEERCTGCNICVTACPKDVLLCVPESNMVHVNCVSTDKGSATRKVCDTGCITCKKCEKECTFDAIHILNNIAIMDYDNCTSCGSCVPVCPTNVISDMSESRKALRIRNGSITVSA